MLRDAIVLAGGLGTRLGPLAESIPKCMQPVAGVPFIDHLVWNLRRQGFSRVIFSLGHLASAVRTHVGDGSALGIEAVYSIEDAPLGTGGAVRLAAEQASQDGFLVVNGDTLFDANYRALPLLLGASSASLLPVMAAMALRVVPDVGRYGAVDLSGSTVRAFGEKAESGAGLVNGGVYAMNRDAVRMLPVGGSSLEDDLFPTLAANGQLAGLESDRFFVDIGTPPSLAESQASVAAWRRKPAVFLDRDGVLNEDRHHVHKVEDFEWLPGAREAVRWLNDSGYLVIVVTNQAGIGRGLYTGREFDHLMDWFAEELAREGAHIDAIYHCPHHPTAGLGEYHVVCECRKPAPGMLVRALREWPIDAGRSIMVGDKHTDLEAAKAAGIRGVLYSGGSLLDVVREALA